MSENDDLIQAARLGTTPKTLTAGNIYAVAKADGSVQQIDLTTDQYRGNPRRLTAAVALTDVDSLLAYWDKHNDTDSDLFADRDRRTITAVIDAHQGKEQENDFRARWQTHRAVLTLTESDVLRAWKANNGKLMTQAEFAEFIEDWMGYIATPDAADLLEMIQSFQATARANFKAGFKVVNGERQFEYTEQIDATVKGGTVGVPTTLTLRLPIWRGASTSEELTARIRYRLNHNGAGQLGLGYKLDRPTEVLDAAFEAEVAKIQEHIGVSRTVLRGTPAGA